jgi:hypothetical protein
MRLRSEGHGRRCARDNAAQRSRRLGGVLSRVRRAAVRDSSRVADERLTTGTEALATSGARGCSRRGLVTSSSDQPSHDGNTRAWSRTLPERVRSCRRMERGPFRMVLIGVLAIHTRSLWLPPEMSLGLLKAFGS